MMPGIIGFPQLDPGYGFGGSPPAEEQEPATKPPQMPMQPDPALEEYDSRQEERIKHLDTIRPIEPPNSGQDKSNNGDGTRNGKSTYTVAEQIRIRNQERAEQDAAAAQRRRQTISRLPSDIDEESRAGEYDSRTAPEILTDPGDEHRSGQVQTFKVLTGTSLDDETQEVAKELAHILKTVDPLVFSEIEPWYTTRLEQAPSQAVAPFPSSYGNMTFPDLISNLDPVGQGGIDTNDKRASSETDERWYRGSETELDPYIQHALANTFSSREWKEEWTKPEHLEGFLKGNLAPFLPKEYIASLPWETLTDFGKIHMYSYLMQTLHDETWHLNSPNSDWNIRLDDAAESAEALLWAVTEVPLVNEAKLVEEFGYPDAVTARIDLTIELQFAYESLGVPPPHDLHEWSLLQLANEYRDVLANVFIPYYRKEMGAEAYSKSLGFAAGYEDIAHSDPETMIARLEGNKQNSPLELIFFVASFFLEPVDLVLTIGDVRAAAGEGDLWGAVWSGLVGLVPGPVGRLGKRSDNIARRVDIPAGQHNWLLENPVPSGSNFIEQADGLLAIPGYPGKKNLREQLMRAAEYNPDLAWKAPDLNSNVAQDAHHIVPKGMSQSARAREILAAKSISVDSHLNGIALNKTAHYLTYGPQYARAVNRAIESLQYAPREEIVMFLEDLARRLDKLNAPDIDHSGIYQKDVMDWLETFK